MDAVMSQPSTPLEGTSPGVAKDAIMVSEAPAWVVHLLPAASTQATSSMPLAYLRILRSGWWTLS